MSTAGRDWVKNRTSICTGMVLFLLITFLLFFIYYIFYGLFGFICFWCEIKLKYIIDFACCCVIEFLTIIFFNQYLIMFLSCFEELETRCLRKLELLGLVEWSYSCKHLMEKQRERVLNKTKEIWCIKECITWIILVPFKGWWIIHVALFFWVKERDICEGEK